MQNCFVHYIVWSLDFQTIKYILGPLRASLLANWVAIEERAKLEGQSTEVIEQVEQKQTRVRLRIG